MKPLIIAIVLVCFSTASISYAAYSPALENSVAEKKESSKSSRDVVLVVSGEGHSTEEATNTALRSAIAQSFGVFVSANTTILNDEMVRDDVATITSGNIKRYDELANIILPDGRKSVTLRATVSISKLVKYAESKGSSCELAGATLAINKRMKDFNRENEKKALNNLMRVIIASLPSCYDWKCEMDGSPLRVAEHSHFSSTPDWFWKIKMVITQCPNGNAKQLQTYFWKTIESICLSDREISECLELGIEVYKSDLTWPYKQNLQHKMGGELNLNSHDGIWFRNDLRDFMRILSIAQIMEMFNFIVVDNLGEENSIQVSADFPNWTVNTKPCGLFKYGNKKCTFDLRWNLPDCPQGDWGMGPSLTSIDFTSKTARKLYLRISDEALEKYSTFQIKLGSGNFSEKFNAILD